MFVDFKISLLRRSGTNNKHIIPCIAPNLLITIIIRLGTTALLIPNIQSIPETGGVQILPSVIMVL